MKKGTKTIAFRKMTGAGNDFVLVDNRKGSYSIDWKSFASFTCDRRYGVGADGLLVLERGIRTPVVMKYFNADGSYGGMCGNGGRCAALFLMNQEGASTVKFESLRFLYSATRAAGTDRVRLRMKNPLDIRLKVFIKVLNEKVLTHFINTGSPHVVIFLDSISEKLRKRIESTGIAEIGRAIREHKAFMPEGTNVNFVRIIGRQTAEMRTYERGVEDETLACGTGSVACAAIISLLTACSSPITIRTRSRERLRVFFERAGERITDVVLEGPAKDVFGGEIMYPPSFSR